MEYELFDPNGHLIKKGEAEPECGRDFCDRCSDCLHCYGDEYCARHPNGLLAGPHRWVKYTDDEEP